MTTKETKTNISPSGVKTEIEKTTTQPPNLAEDVKHMFQEAKETIKGWGKKFAGKTEDIKECASEKMSEAGEKVKEGVQNVQDAGGEVKEKVKDISQTAAEKLKEGKEMTGEKLEKLGKALHKK
jgi:ElaB/YqjD/DUF883 family membrane-anchored ribosome-binding protein